MTIGPTVFEKNDILRLSPSVRTPTVFPKDIINAVSFREVISIKCWNLFKFFLAVFRENRNIFGRGPSEKVLLYGNRMFTFTTHWPPLDHRPWIKLFRPGTTEVHTHIQADGIPETTSSYSGNWSRATLSNRVIAISTITKLYHLWSKTISRGSPCVAKLLGRLRFNVV